MPVVNAELVALRIGQDHRIVIDDLSLARLNDNSSFLDKQDQQCQRWAEAYGHEIIGAAQTT